MWAVRAVEYHPVFDDPPRSKAVMDFIEIYGLLLQVAPQPFAEDFVQISSPCHPSRCARPPRQRGDPGRSGGLAALLSAKRRSEPD